MECWCHTIHSSNSGECMLLHPCSSTVIPSRVLLHYILLTDVKRSGREWQTIVTVSSYQSCSLQGCFVNMCGVVSQVDCVFSGKRLDSIAVRNAVEECNLVNFKISSYSTSCAILETISQQSRDHCVVFCDSSVA